MEDKGGKWSRCLAYADGIERETDRAVLIKLPGKEKRFWHPKALVGTKGGMLLLSFPPGWECTVFDGNGFRQAVPGSIICDVFGALPQNQYDEDSYLVVESPKKVDREVIVPDELKNDRRTS